MTYEAAIAYLETFVDYERKTNYHYKAAFKLERMEKFLSNLGSPQEGLKVIHVAGTKGKGSTSCFIAHILKEEGFRVGLYTSPHLKDFRERIRILDPNNTADEKSPFPGMILKNEFVALLETVKPQIDFFRRSFQNFGQLTFFEILTALALKHFSDKNADLVVLETGLGGRLDATNAVDSLVAVLTPVSYDHEHILGTTLAEIAFEKAGIIKSSNVKTKAGVSLCVGAEQHKAAREILKRRARAQDAMLFESGRDFRYKKLSADLFGQDFFYRGLNNKSFFLKTRMLGNHQLANASLALAACEALSLHGIRIKSDAMERGVLNAFWPGRLEIVHSKPFVILDGAHNRHSAQRLVSFLEKEFKKFPKWLVFGTSEDKDIKSIIETLEPLADRIILTRADHPRAANPEKDLRPHFKKKVLRLTSCVEEALDILHKEIRPEDVAVITGSLFVVGEARSIWKR